MKIEKNHRGISSYFNKFPVNSQLAGTCREGERVRFKCEDTEMETENRAQGFVV